MTTMVEPTGDGLDVRTFLLGDDGPAALRDRLARALADDDGRVAGLAEPVRRALDEELTEVVQGLLRVDLGATALKGWRLHQDLLAAARTTQDTPGLVQRVPMADHTVTSTWRPRVQALLGGKPVAELAFALEVSLTLVGLSATVTGGRLTRLGGGSGTASAVLSLGGRPVMSRTAPFDACASVPLGAGVPLLSAEEPSVAAAPAVVEADDGPAPVPRQRRRGSPQVSRRRRSSASEDGRR